MKVTHILVRTSDVDGINPSIIHFYSVEEVKKYISTFPDVLTEKMASFYKVEEIKPTRKVVIDVSL